MFVITIIVAILCIALVIMLTISAVRRGQQLDKILDVKKEKHGFLPFILQHLWPIGAAVVGGFKFVYKAWRSAPPNSWPKFGWGILLAAIIAGLCWLVVYIIDRKLNGRRIAFEKLLWTPEESNERPV